MRIEWLPRARRNLDNQIRYITMRNPAAALEQDAIVERVVSKLADFPEAGRSGRVRNTRELVIPGTQFVAVYRVNRDRKMIYILRFLHAKQKYPPE